MSSTIDRLEKGTIKLTITIPWETVEKTKEEVIENSVKNAEFPGFRVGKAPRKLVEEKLDKSKIQEEVLKKILPDAYINAVQTHNIRPIMNPKIHVEKLEEKNPWVFTALTCETPEIKLNDYKTAVGKVTAKSKIVIPGKEDQKQEVKFEEIVNALLESSSIEIPNLLVEHETDRLLSQLLDDVKRLGLTLDQYLASTGKTPESLRSEYQKKAESDLSLEFALQKIAEVEKITVEDKEINEAILKAKDDKERKNLEANRYVLASILRQQKTLDFLRSL